MRLAGVLVLISLGAGLAQASIQGKCCTPRSEGAKGKVHSCCDDSESTPSQSQDPCADHGSACKSPCCSVCVSELPQLLVVSVGFTLEEKIFDLQPKTQFLVPPTPPPNA